MSYSYHTAKAYLAQCRWRKKLPTWAGLRAFSTPLKLTTRMIEPEDITIGRSDTNGVHATYPC